MGKESGRRVDHWKWHDIGFSGCFPRGYCWLVSHDGRAISGRGYWRACCVLLCNRQSLYYGLTPSRPYQQLPFVKWTRPSPLVWFQWKQKGQHVVSLSQVSAHWEVYNFVGLHTRSCLVEQFGESSNLNWLPILMVNVLKAINLISFNERKHIFWWY